MEPLLLSESKSNGVNRENPNWKNDSLQDTQLQKREFLKEALREWVLNEQWQEKEREKTKKKYEENFPEKPSKQNHQNALKVWEIILEIWEKGMQKQSYWVMILLPLGYILIIFYYFGRCNYWITNLYNILKIFKWFAF